MRFFVPVRADCNLNDGHKKIAGEDLLEIPSLNG
jgi:hypothetical protein